MDIARALAAVSSGLARLLYTSERPPSRKMTRDMVDIMGSSGLAWHQWKKHGSCSGLSAAEYFAKSREAYGTITQPKVLYRLD